MNKKTFLIITSILFAGACTMMLMHGNTGLHHILEEIFLPLLVSAPIILMGTGILNKRDSQENALFIALAMFTHIILTKTLVVVHKARTINSAIFTPDSQPISLAKIESFSGRHNDAHFFGDINATQRLYVKTNNIHTPVRFMQVSLNNNTKYHCVTSSETPDTNNCYLYKINGLVMYCDDKTGELVCTNDNPNNYLSKFNFH